MSAYIPIALLVLLAALATGSGLARLLLGSGCGITAWGIATLVTGSALVAVAARLPTDHPSTPGFILTLGMATAVAALGAATAALFRLHHASS
ncbi:hypothetical protein SAMN05660831_00896 [Thiohalospira halophila DSM 15071]|uniref:Uncharacterized protein n=1 Tax=Thiohalospira halophila DSM 15071 TaxID=1123397 RepID=A0A1I1Q5P0_9GAMM|nr:hypothetical protein [Thiohalospira halophila]SFD15168.1 hypothetical protein SAMN05660831_00896 [Thiohalospira halophila DSM 15071]